MHTAPRRHPAFAGRRFHLLAFALVSLAWLALVFPAPAAATPGAPPARWTYDWRPGWMPGDPEEPLFELFATPWAPRSVVSPGIFVALDPETGLPTRPSAEQRRALSAALLPGGGATARSDAPLPTQRIPSGGELVHLPEGFQVFLVAHRNAQGGFTIDCATDPGPLGSTDSPPEAPSRSLEER